MGISRLIISIVFASSVVLAACSEDVCLESDGTADGATVQLSIRGDFDDIETRASITNIFRMKWSDNDKVYVYGKNGSSISCLGTLTATVVPGSDSRVADLTGTITAPNPSTGKLTLLYSPLFSAAPAPVSDDVTVDLSQQSGEGSSVTFVAYSAVDFNGSTSQTIRTSFRFATSVVRANVTGLAVSRNIASATITNIENTCRISVKADSEPTISGANQATIIRSFDTLSSNANGCTSFYVAIPAVSANANRMVSIAQDGGLTYSVYNFAGVSSPAGTILNATNPVEPLYPGSKSSPVAMGNTFWAPVNCGYEEGKCPYGRIYQFGRMVGSAYSTAEGTMQTFKPASYTSNYNKTPLATEFYDAESSGIKDWYTDLEANQFDSWPMTAPAGTTGIGNPCPEGWQVPTIQQYDELKDFGNIWCTRDGIDGTQFTAGSGATLFLPAAGQCNGAAFKERGTWCYYWSLSTAQRNAQGIRINKGSDNKPFIEKFSDSRYLGYYVRCVRK